MLKEIQTARLSEERKGGLSPFGEAETVI